MISIFTPTHKPDFLPQVHASLQDQTCKDFEWVIAPNNGAVIPDAIAKDPKVRVLPEISTDFVGALKRYACSQAKGDYLFELDHDDVLQPTAIAETMAAFDANPNVGFVYSNALHATGDLSKTERYSDVYGWKYRETEYQGRMIDEPISFEPTPEAISRIWYAPNHLRAFRRDVYEKVGGYSDKMRVLDDQDLMCRLFKETHFHHIDRGLYVYRIHGENSWIKHNAEIQTNVWRLYDQYVQDIAVVHAKRKSLRCIELGGRFDAQAGFETVDLKDADVCCDLEGRWPFEDSSVGVIRAADIFEHLKDPIQTMQECYRVLAPGGWIFAQVPSTDGRGAWQDPTHKSFWNENSWAYYTNRKWARYIDTPVRFQAIRVRTTPKDAREVCWTIAHMISLKDGYRPPGLIEI